MQRQLNETHAEVMGSSDLESHDDDSLGALGGPIVLTVRLVQQANKRPRVLSS